MMSGSDLRGQLWSKGYLLLTTLLHPFLSLHLRRRLARGKEDPRRWREKLGVPSAVRGQGPLVWLHAVGLGETLALRGVIAALQERRPGVRFLVTSGTRASAEVFANNAPDDVTHQYLPLDTARNVRAFLDHWRPDLSIWTEQELWPGFVFGAAKRHIPLAYINARLTDESFIRRKRTSGLYRALFAKFTLISAQDGTTVQHLQALGASDVKQSGSLKSSAPPLGCDPGQLDELRATIKGRFVWIAASTHKEDEEVVLAAQAELLQSDPGALLVVIPRHPERAGGIVEAAQQAGLSVSQEQAAQKQVWVVGRFGELGLWYRLAQVAYIGGTMSKVEGHNPWEAAILSCPVLFGPRYQNFKADFPALQQAGGALMVEDAEKLAGTLQKETNWHAVGTAARDCAEKQKRALAQLFDELAALCP